ncbi:hypothetical protein F2Q69_00052213 [Brassica cretica]|uniref:Uncharacterized protein n=1 Tax=Brassica cretica TaxID=69181 RepID=A0A8S9MWE1_BRACR|nr:hypothetical protein F2Q69_00052213 [Brassica cretica]
MITVLSGRLKRKMNLDKKEEPTNVFAGTNKIHGVILILKRIIESVPEVYSLSKALNSASTIFGFLPLFTKKQLLLHLESDDSAQNVLSSFSNTADSPHVGIIFSSPC